MRFSIEKNIDVCLIVCKPIPFKLGMIICLIVYKPISFKLGMITCLIVYRPISFKVGMVTITENSDEFEKVAASVLFLTRCSALSVEAEEGENNYNDDDEASAFTITGDSVFLIPHRVTEGQAWP